MEKVEPVIRKTMNNKLKTYSDTRYKAWITDEIKDLMMKKRKIKNKNDPKYKRLNKYIKVWLTERYEKMERLKSTITMTFNLEFIITPVQQAE